MRNGKTWLLLAVAATCFAVTAHAENWIDGSSTVIGPRAEVHCKQGITCAIEAGQLAISTGVQSETTGTSTILNGYQCGQTYITSGSVTVDLPYASENVGCRYTIVQGASGTTDVRPHGSDQIQVLTNAGGDRIRSAVQYNAIVLQAVTSTSWAAVGSQGTWSDVN